MAAGALCVGMAALGRAAIAGEQVTDEMIAAWFRKPHAVMKELRANLHDVLDGFLTGDVVRIQTGAAAVAARMSEVSRMYPPQGGQETDEWKALAEIVEQAALLKQKAALGDYRSAYTHYATLTHRCIVCHQVRRTSGQFSEPQTPQSAGTAEDHAGSSWESGKAR